MAWSYLGSTKLDSAGKTISVDINHKIYLYVSCFIIRNSGGVNPRLRFNSSNSGYTFRQTFSLDNNSSESTSQSGIAMCNGVSADPDGAFSFSLITSESGKLAMVEAWSASDDGTQDASVVPSCQQIVGNWSTTDDITNVSLVNTGTANFESGSEVVVFGTDSS